MQSRRDTTTPRAQSVTFGAWVEERRACVRFVFDPCAVGQNCSDNLSELCAVGDDPKMVPRGLEPRTLRLLAVRSDQLSYETGDEIPVF